MAIQLICADAWHAGPERVGQHADRADGRGARVLLRQLCPVHADALPHQCLLHHLCLLDFLVDDQGDIQAILCLYGQASRLNGRQTELTYASGASCKWTQLQRLVRCAGLLSLSHQ